MRVTSSPVIESIMIRLFGNTASALIGSIRPRISNIQNTFGPNWMPAPISLNSDACSMTCDGMPLRASAKAAASPPIPPPTIRTCWSFQLLMASPLSDPSGLLTADKSNGTPQSNRSY